VSGDGAARSLRMAREAGFLARAAMRKPGKV